MRALSLAIAVTFFSLSAAQAAGPAPSPGSPQRDRVVSQQGNATLGNSSGQDIMALAFIVMMEAAKSAQEDLKAIMAQVKAINDAKKEQRKNLQRTNRLGSHPPCALIDCLEKVERKVAEMKLAALDLMRASVILTRTNADLLFDSLRRAPEEIERIRKNERPPARMIPANPCRGWNPSFWKQCAKAMKVELTASAPDARTQAEIDAQLDALIREFDAMSDMSQEISLRLQQIMERKSAFMSMLSNLMKKISDTRQSIVQNMK